VRSGREEEEKFGGGEKLITIDHSAVGSDNFPDQENVGE
jgi:hypothetical protein